MSDNILSFLLFKSLYQPLTAFEELSRSEPSALRIFFNYSLWLLILPPAFALIGAANFGWRLGASEPLMLDSQSLWLVSLAYFLVLVFGLITTTMVSCWMGSTYGADCSFGRNLALVTIIGEPLAVASVVHLYPDVFINMLVLIPTMMWAMYLLYKGIPIALKTPPERGMLMASSMVGWLLVAAVSLLGLSMAAWTQGFGPTLGV